MQTHGRKRLPAAGRLQARVTGARPAEGHPGDSQGRLRGWRAGPLLGGREKRGCTWGGADISAWTGGRAPVPASPPVTPPHGDRESSRAAALPGTVLCGN